MNLETSSNPSFAGSSSPGRRLPRSLLEWAGFGLALFAAVALSPTTFDYLFVSFTSIPLPIGTYGFAAFLGLTALLLVTGQVNAPGLLAVAMLTGVCFCLALTSMWSPSTTYLATKLPLVLGMPAILFAAGHYIASNGLLQRFAVMQCALSLAVLLGIWLFGIDVIVGFQTGLDQEFGGRYQSISRVLALSAVLFAALGLAANKIHHRLALLAFSAIMLFQVLFTGGRVGLLIVLIAAPLIYLSTFNPRIRTVLLALFGILVFLLLTEVDLLAVAEAIWPGEMPLTIQRILLDFTTEDPGAFQLLDRENLWRLAGELWWEEPLFGVGLAGFPVSAGIGDIRGVYPHNIILELAAETGVFGLSLFFAFLMMLFLARPQGVISASDRILAIAVVASGTAISLVISDFGLQRELFLGLGLYYGLRFPKQANTRSLSAPVSQSLA